MPYKVKKVKKVEAGIWLLDTGEYLVDFRPNGSGQRFRKIQDTKADARQYKSWATTQLGENPEWKPKKRSKQDNRRLTALIEEWYELHGLSLDDGTRQKNKLLAMSAIMGNPIARKIDKESLADYRPLRLAEGIKPKTINNEHGYLVALFNTLINLGKWPYENKVAGIKKLKLSEKELAYLETPQIVDLLAALDSLGFVSVRLITELCLATGARWSEAVNLHSRHIKTGRVQYVDTKTDINRWVEIEPDLEKQLRALGEGYIFGRTRCEKKFRQAIALANIDLPEGQLTHVLRHTFATTYLSDGGDIKTLQAILGHQNLSSTMVYLKVVAAMKAKVVELNPIAKMRRQTPPEVALIANNNDEYNIKASS
jgi:integrase